MSLTPPQSGVESCEVQSPDIFMSDIRCNLNSQFLNTRDSIQAENMCVYARVRPMLPQEVAKGFKECIAAIDEKTIRTVIPVSSSRYKSSRQSEEVEDFSFSSAFGPETGQFVFFLETMLPTLQNFVEGGNSLIFSYGITGSGKTYTLQGNSENPGIIPLSLRLYFAAVQKQLLEGIKVKPNMYNNIIALSASEQREEYKIKKQLLSLYDDECEIVPGSFRSSNSKTFAMTLCDLFSDDFKAEERQTTLGPEEMASAQAATVMKEVIRNSAESQHGVCNVWVSFVEIYNENIFDLLTPITNERKRLMLRECNGNVYIEGAKEICISNGDEALKILNIGRKNLSIASTRMNYQSSRSHCIYTIRVVRVRDANNLSYGKVNRLSFCDLAGSERTAKTQTTGIRLKEAGSINTSLLVLGRCLEQLRMNQMGRDKRMIPFRDSKLTRLFSGFFMGQGKAVMIANASPCDYTYDETSHVLKFSALARKLKVNDTFYSDATSTLQSICNEWSNASNRSMCNESTDSLDSDSEIIQKKDEIIEKLLILAEKLTKKEQENADMEMKIRREVCREYSEYSDQLLEEKRIMYEEQMEAIRENYKKMIANRDKMYEKIIKDYEHRLNDTVDSNEDTFNNSHSIMELENSTELSPEKLLNMKNVDKSEESYQSQSSKLKELESTLESVTAELEKAKEQLCESQKSVANLDKELRICKEEKENLSKECVIYKDVASKSIEDARKYESDIKDLEKQLCILKKELDTTKELNQTKKFNLHEMETELKICKEEKENLSNVCADYKNAAAKLTEDVRKYEADIKDLEEQLCILKKELDATKELNQTKEFNLHEMETELKICKEEKENLSNVCADYKNAAAKLTEDVRKYEADIKDLEEQLCILKKELDTTKELNQTKEFNLHEMETELKICKEEKVNLSNECADYKNAAAKLTEDVRKYEADIKDLEEQLCILKKELDATKELNQTKEFNLYEMGSDNDRLKGEVKTLKKDIHGLKDTIETFEANMEEYKTKISVLEDELLCSEKKCVSAKEDLQIHMNSASEMEKENEVLKSQVRSLDDKLLTIEKDYAIVQEKLLLKLNSGSEIEKENGELKSELKTLTKQINEFKEEIKKYISAAKDYESKICNLEGTLMSNEKHFEEQLQEKLNLTSQLKKDIEDINIENEKIRTEMKKLKESKVQDEEIMANYKAEIHTLEDKLFSINQDYVKTAEELQNCSKDVPELEKEIEMYKNEIKILKTKSSEVAERLKEVLKENESKDQNFEQMTASLQEKLKAAEEELKKIFLHSIELLSELEVDDCQANTATKVKKSYEQFSDSYKSYQSVTKKLKEMISTLHQDLLVANKNADLIKTEMKVREAVSAELEKEIDMYKHDIEALKGKMLVKDELEKKLMSLNQELETVKDVNKQISSKLNNIEMSRNSEEPNKEARDLITEKLEEELSLVQKKLNTAVSDIQEKNLKIAELESEKNAHDSEIQNLKKHQQMVESEVTEMLRTARDEIQQLSSELRELQNANSTYEEDNKELKKIHETLTEKLDSANKEVCRLSSELRNRNSTCDLGTQTLEQTEQIIELKLTEKLQLVDKELKSANEEIQKLSSKICELEKTNSTYEKDNKELKKVHEILTEKLDSTNKEVCQLSSELLNRKSTCEFGTQTLKQNEQIGELELTEKLQLDDLETANEEVQKLSSKICELEKEKNVYESKIQKLKQNQQTVEAELTEKLHLVDGDLKSANEKIQELSSKICELEKENTAYESEIDKLKQQQEQQFFTLNEKLLFTTKELETANEDIHQKCSKLHELQNSIDMLKLEIEKVQGEKQNLISEKMALQEKLVVIEREIEILKEDIQQKSTNELKTESEIRGYKKEINKLKEDYANLCSEKLKYEREVDYYKEKVEKLQKNSTLDINTVNQNKLKELENEITTYKCEIKKMKGDKELSDKEKEDLMMVISTNNEKIDDLEDKLTALNEDLNAANHDVLIKTTTVKDLQNRLDQFCTLVELLGKCEIRASDRIKKLQDAIEKHKSQDLYLQNQIKNKENSIEELEKAVFDLQEQLKNLQRSCDHKLVSELEQHETEIVQTMKLKHLVEEENMNLKKQKLKSFNSKLKSIDAKKTGNTTEALLKKNVGNKGKENVPEVNLTRAQRKKEMNLKEASFSDIECSTPIVDKVKSRKRVSDEDFDPSNARASKKMKCTEASKIPTKRSSRRKLQSDNTETLSPIQKITNSITSKVKVLSSNIPHISSPRLTRGRKKLFNLEAPTSSGSQRATKEKK